MDIKDTIHNLLTINKQTIAVAESCTGGLLSKLLTDKPGSSHFFILGIVAYSNQAKQAILKIPAKVLAQKGAVSQVVARNLAYNVRKLALTDFGISITGIAGPTGAAKGKPLGTVFIAIDSKSKKICRKFIFKGNRNQIRNTAALKALVLLKAFFK